MPARLSRSVRWCAALMSSAVLVGCAGSGGASVSPAPTPEETLITPVVRGAESGLEARLWVVENRAGVLAGALRGYAPPLTADPGEVETWRRNGLRVFEVPMDRLDSVLGVLPTIGPRHREWMGLLPEWVEVVKGARIGTDQLMELDSGAARLGPGQLRLVARCWAAPRAGDTGAVLNIEVMPELMVRREDDALSRLMDPGVTPKSGLRGMAFERLRLGVEADGSNAIVIVPEDPEVDWSAGAEGRPESADDPAGGRDVIGPRMPETPSLGELMLTSLALPESAGDARVVVVLVPRVPDRFSLLPR